MKLDKGLFNNIEYKSFFSKGKINSGSLTTKNKENE